MANAYENFYNPELKKRFVQEEDASNSRGIFTGTFLAAAEFENELGKDIGEFTQQELEDTFLSRYCVKLTGTTMLDRLRMIRHYRRWYREKILGLDVEKPQGKIRDELVQVRKVQVIPDDKRQFRTEEAFVKCVETVFGSERYIMQAAVMILYYYGFSKEQVTQIKLTDVDSTNHTVCGVKIENEKLFDLIYKCKHTFKYTLLTDNQMAYSPRQMTYNATSYLIRTTGLGRATSDEDCPVSIQSLSLIARMKYKAIDDVGAQAKKYEPYTFDRIKIAKLRICLRCEQDETKLGEAEIKRRINKKQYSTESVKMTYDDYVLWKNTAIDP